MRARDLGRLSFDDELLDQLADRLADRLVARLELALKPGETLINAGEVARIVGKTRAWVYDHAGELGAVRLGTGPKPRLGFYPARVHDHLESVASPPPIPHPTPAPPRRRPRDGYTAAGTKLLAVRGHQRHDT
jgi:hypothetical protein